jgi:hypothetical protein
MRWLAGLQGLLVALAVLPCTAEFENANIVSPTGVLRVMQATGSVSIIG